MLYAMSTTRKACPCLPSVPGWIAPSCPTTYCACLQEQPGALWAGTARGCQRHGIVCSLTLEMGLSACLHTIPIAKRVQKSRSHNGILGQLDHGVTPRTAARFSPLWLYLYAIFPHTLLHVGENRLNIQSLVGNDSRHQHKAIKGHSPPPSNCSTLSPAPWRWCRIWRTCGQGCPRARRRRYGAVGRMIPPASTTTRTVNRGVLTQYAVSVLGPIVFGRLVEGLYHRGIPRLKPIGYRYVAIHILGKHGAPTHVQPHELLDGTAL